MRAWFKMVTWIVCMAVLIVGLCGCEEDEIQAYQAPKEALVQASDLPFPPPPPDMLPDLPPPPNGPSPSAGQSRANSPRTTGTAGSSSSNPDRGDKAIQWVVPSHWRADPNASSILYAAFDVDTATGSVRVTVTVLPGDAGGVLANVNRWRGQMRLEPVSRLEDETVTSLTVADQPAMMVDLAQPTGQDADRMLAVILPRAGRTWFFKMTGTSQAVADQKQSFIQFVESVRFE